MGYLIQGNSPVAGFQWTLDRAIVLERFGELLNISRDLPTLSDIVDLIRDFLLQSLAPYYTKLDLGEKGRIARGRAGLNICSVGPHFCWIRRARSKCSTLFMEVLLVPRWEARSKARRNGGAMERGSDGVMKLWCCRHDG